MSLDWEPFFFVFGLFLVSRVTYVSRLGTSFFLSSVCVLCPELHTGMSLDWEPVFLSLVCFLCPVLQMSLDCQSPITPSVFSDVYIMMIQNKKYNFAFEMRYKRNPKRI